MPKQCLCFIFQLFVFTGTRSNLVGNNKQHALKRNKIAVTVASGSMYAKGQAGYSAYPLSTRIPYPPPPPPPPQSEPVPTVVNDS